MIIDELHLQRKKRTRRPTTHVIFNLDIESDEMAMVAVHVVMGELQRAIMARGGFLTRVIL